jgi:hypothetical protein
VEFDNAQIRGCLRVSSSQDHPKRAIPPCGISMAVQICRTRSCSISIAASLKQPPCKDTLFPANSSQGSPLWCSPLKSRVTPPNITPVDGIAANRATCWAENRWRSRAALPPGWQLFLGHFQSPLPLSFTRRNHPAGHIAAARAVLPGGRGIGRAARALRHALICLGNVFRECSRAGV